MDVGRLLLLLVAALLLLRGSSSALALDATRAATAVWRGEREVDVLLGVETNDERGHVDNLLANTVIRRSQETGNAIL